MFTTNATQKKCPPLPIKTIHDQRDRGKTIVISWIDEKKSTNTEKCPRPEWLKKHNTNRLEFSLLKLWIFCCSSLKYMLYIVFSTMKSNYWNSICLLVFFAFLHFWTFLEFCVLTLIKFLCFFIVWNFGWNHVDQSIALIMGAVTFCRLSQL